MKKTRESLLALMKWSLSPTELSHQPNEGRERPTQMSLVSKTRGDIGKLDLFGPIGTAVVSSYIH